MSDIFNRSMLSWLYYQIDQLETISTKIKYYNALVHDGVKEKPFVCYNPDLYNLMQQAHTVDRPVRITNFH